MAFTQKLPSAIEDPIMRKTKMKNKVRHAKVPPQNPKIEVIIVKNPIVAIIVG